MSNNTVVKMFEELGYKVNDAKYAAIENNPDSDAVLYRTAVVLAHIEGICREVGLPIHTALLELKRQREEEKVETTSLDDYDNEDYCPTARG